MNNGKFELFFEGMLFMSIIIENTYLHQTPVALLFKAFVPTAVACDLWICVNSAAHWSESQVSSTNCFHTAVRENHKREKEILKGKKKQVWVPLVYLEPRQKVYLWPVPRPSTKFQKIQFSSFYVILLTNKPKKKKKTAKGKKNPSLAEVINQCNYAILLQQRYIWWDGRGCT